jgi:hypothetical protein
MFFFGDFTAFFAADFLAAGVFAAEDILSNKNFIGTTLYR